MTIITKGKNNWKLIVIVVVLAVFAGIELLTYIRNFNSDMTFLSFFLEGKKPDQNIKINNEAIEKIFAEKYPQYGDTLSISIEKETKDYARGSVSFVTGAPGGIFLAENLTGKWHVVYEGNGQIPCDDLSYYGFPSDMLSDCATQEISNPTACPMDAKLCPDGSYIDRTGPNCDFAECPDSNINQNTKTISDFGVSELVSNNLPDSIEFWTQAYCPESGTPFDYKIPSGYRVDSCSYGPIGSHNGCDVCTMSKIKLVKGNSGILSEIGVCGSAVNESSRPENNLCKAGAIGEVGCYLSLGGGCSWCWSCGKGSGKVSCCEKNSVSGEENITPAEASFSYPYPLSWTWKEDSSRADFSLTKVSLGERTIPSFAYSTTHNPGDKVYALTLSFKINTYWENTYVCIPTGLRIILNEEGDKMAPINDNFNVDCQAGNRTYYDQEVIFVVPEIQNVFTLTTGGNSNIFFTVTLLENGQLKVEKSYTGE